LAHARVLDADRVNGDSVQLLCKVELADLTHDRKLCYTLASPHEANLREGKISIKSPIAQALLNKRVGDVVDVKVPAGILKLRIESISL
jgi:transcription elongation factor GreA